MTPYELKSARHALGLSAEGFARLVRVGSGRTVRRWESGERDIPGPVAVLVEAIITRAAVPCSKLRTYSGQNVMTFERMLQELRVDGTFTQSDIAKSLGISPQYLCDLERGRRRPSVAVVNRICEYLGRKEQGRREWHAAAARACGWDV